MKIIKYWLAFLGLTVFLTGCMDIIEKPDSSSAGEYIWDNFDMAQLYLDKLYLDNMPTSAWGGNITSTDEALGTGASNFLYGVSGIDAATDYSADFWARMRRINLMIQEMHNRSTLSDSIINVLVAQARFLRAIQYWQLVRLYGGIPIVDKPLDPVLDQMDKPRATTSACIRFILDDLDNAIQNLPTSWLQGFPNSDNYGRLTSLAAQAYRGRVTMTFASPMFTQRDAYVSMSNGEAIPAYSQSADSIQMRWEMAYDDNKLALDNLLANNYSLVPEWKNIFITEAISNPEAIMVRLYTGVTYIHNWEYRIRPSSLGGYGHMINPTIQLEQSFLMADGKRTSDSTAGYDSLYYWFDRDPRFYQTIVYNGATWDMGGSTGRKQWMFDGIIGEADIPPSGMYCRKGQDVSLTRENINRGKTDWMEIRLAEVMLNLAECANEVGRQAEAISLVRQIRQRAGILPGDDQSYGVSDNLTKIELLDVIMNERLIELAFENQRYWDLRRRMMYTRDLSPMTHKLNNTRRTGWEIWTQVYPNPLDPRNAIDMKDSLNMEVSDGVYLMNTLTLTKENYKHYFDPVAKAFDLNRVGNPKPDNPRSSLGIYYRPDYYFMPIGTDRFSNSTNLIQTIGWGYGTFDPLAE